MNEEVRTLKIYGKSTHDCYKVEVREKDLGKANVNSEWMEERTNEEPFEQQEKGYEEPAEEIEVTYTPDEVLIHGIDELDCHLLNIKEYDVRTLK
ncbi:hypothetical protein A2U01_0059778, partial [Trifolium medium]|nr:hypothetical protein [Trifolium medium]